MIAAMVEALVRGAAMRKIATEPVGRVEQMALLVVALDDHPGSWPMWVRNPGAVERVASFVRRRWAVT